MFEFLRRKRIDRNQWFDEASQSRQTYEQQMLWTWDETREKAPNYFRRLEFTVGRAQGAVLEIGCGIGTMTRWLAATPAVTSVLAVDAFAEPVAALRARALPKVTAARMDVRDLALGPDQRFDTVLLCEVIEHLYPDEERAMLRRLRPHVGKETRFVVSTPVGFMPDPFHVRGFSKRAFLRHVRRRYGEPLEVDYSSGYSQCAFGLFRA